MTTNMFPSIDVTTVKKHPVMPRPNIGQLGLARKVGTTSEPGFRLVRIRTRDERAVVGQGAPAAAPLRLSEKLMKCPRLR
jgi:hypothetical protein